METYAQYSIRHCLDMIAPIEASEQSGEDGRLQFYRFMVSLYQAMYREPETFMVSSKRYEEYRIRLGQREAQKKKEKEHAADSRESTLRNTFQQAIQFYASYFYRIGLRCKEIDEQSGALLVRKEDYSDVMNQMNRIHDSKNNLERYEVLSKLGLQVSERGDMVHIIHRTDTRMMEGVAYLCKAPDSKYKWMNFLRLDYKNAYSPIPTVEDICRTLSDREADIVKKLEHYLAGMRIKTKIKPLRGIVSDFKWKVEYSCHGKSICGFYADKENFTLCLHFNHFQNITEFAKVLEAEDYSLFQWFRNQFPERLCKCPNNRRIYFGQEPRRICGLSNRAEIVNPGDDDIDRALYLLGKYRNIDISGAGFDSGH